MRERLIKEMSRASDRPMLLLYTLTEDILGWIAGRLNSPRNENIWSPLREQGSINILHCGAKLAMASMDHAHIC